MSNIDTATWLETNGERLPCGCLIGRLKQPSGERQFVVRPCSMDCTYYQYMTREAGRQKKEVRFKNV